MSFIRSLVLALVVVGVVGGAAAQSNAVITPQAIVINPTPSFTVSVRVDMDPSGRGTPIYFEGDPIALRVVVNEDAYVYLFNVSSRGGISQFYPNRYDGMSNFVRANTPLQLPSSRYTLSVARPFGTDKVIAIASKRELDTRSLAWFVSEMAGGACGADCFAAASLDQAEFAQALSIVVGRNPQESWVTDTVRFQIRRRWW